MVSKKGDLSLNFIIIAILALIALIVIALFFTGGITKLFGTQKEISKVSLDPQLRALAEANCRLHCTNQDENAYMGSASIPKELSDAGYTDCEKLLSKPFSECFVQKSCQKEDAASAVSCIGTTQASCEAVSGCAWK